MVPAPRKYFTDEERRAARRRTNAKYHRTAKGQASMQRANADPKARERYARYRQTDGYRAAQERRRIKDQAAGWPIQTARRRELRAFQPDMVNAWMAVRWALILGVIARPESCESCREQRKLHAHHYLGYERPHWLDVRWLCAPCHKRAHS